jgi:hypothetical protein
VVSVLPVFHGVIQVPHGRTLEIEEVPLVLLWHEVFTFRKWCHAAVSSCPSFDFAPSRLTRNYDETCGITQPTNEWTACAAWGSFFLNFRSVSTEESYRNRSSTYARTHKRFKPHPYQTRSRGSSPYLFTSMKRRKCPCPGTPE